MSTKTLWADVNKFVHISINQIVWNVFFPLASIISLLSIWMDNEEENSRWDT